MKKSGFLLAVVLFLIISPIKSYAHSALIHATPDLGSALTSSPDKVLLTFNERIENELFYIQVLDSQGKSVTDNKSQLSQDQVELQLDLPQLGDGVYTVSYKIVSADGHPVEGSYVYTVGQASPESMQKPQLENGSGFTAKFIFLYVSRFLFFASLLSITGWIFWKLLHRPESAEILEYDQSLLRKLQWVFLTSLLLMIVAQLLGLMNGWQLKDLVSILFGTPFGYSWLISLVLSITGFYVLSRWRWLDFIWIALLIAAKVGNGHAMAFSPKINMVIFDFIHLFSAAIWVGGLLYVLVHWRKHHVVLKSFLPQFSKYVWISMVLLVISGTFYTLGILPRIENIFYTQWGILLLIKVCLVVFVFVVGSLLRHFLKKKNTVSVKRLIKMDVGLLVSILMIVGVFTHLNPMPANKTFDWIEVTDSVKMSAEITPNAPGNNMFSLNIWLPDVMAEPKSVELILINKDNPSIAPIEVPIVESAHDIKAAVYEGFQSYSYMAMGAYLPFPGRWELKVKVFDPNDLETQFSNKMMIF